MDIRQFTHFSAVLDSSFLDDKHTMTWCPRTGTVLIVALALSGCATRGNIDLLESRLRSQEDSLYEMESQLATTNGELDSARLEANQLRTQLANRGEKTLLPEQANALYRVTSIEIDPLLSGGLNNDGEPGDDALNVALVPQDSDGESIKVTGEIQLELFDLSNSKTQQRIGLWTFGGKELRQYWRRGFLGSGYVFNLPWQQVPSHSQLVLHAKMTTADGRQFDTSETLKIVPPKETNRIGANSPADVDDSSPSDEVFSGSTQFTDVPDSDTINTNGPANFQSASDETLAAPPLDLESAFAGDRKSESTGDDVAPAKFPSPNSGKMIPFEPNEIRQIGYESDPTPLIDLDAFDSGDRKAQHQVSDHFEKTRAVSSPDLKEQFNFDPGTPAVPRAGSNMFTDSDWANEKVENRPPLSEPKMLELVAPDFSGTSHKKHDWANSFPDEGLKTEKRSEGLSLELDSINKKGGSHSHQDSHSHQEQAIPGWAQ